MKDVRNKTARPIRVPLPRGKVLHLGPSQVAQISEKAALHGAVKRLVEEDLIEILGEGERAATQGTPGIGAAETHGNVRASFHRRRGE